MNAEQGAGVYFAAMDDVPIHPDPAVDLRKRWIRTWVKVALLIPLGMVVGFLMASWRLSSSAPGPAMAAAGARAHMNGLDVALLNYKAKGGVFPSQAQGLEALMTRPTTAPVPRAWSQLLAFLPRDPWNHPYVYRFPSANPAKAYDLLSLGPDGVPSADDIVNSSPSPVSSTTRPLPTPTNPAQNGLKLIPLERPKSADPGFHL